MFNRSKESNSVTPVEEMKVARRATGDSSTGASECVNGNETFRSANSL